jgi:DNA polymerase-3 subunit chi
VTEIEFHTRVADPLGFACRLLRKAHAKGARVVVHAGNAAQATALDRALWTFDPLAFVPHARAGTPAPAATPIWIVERLAEAPHHDVLLNLADDVAAGFETFARLIEVVGADAAEAGRRRWRHYSARGYPVLHHHAGQAGEDTKG